MRRIFITVLVGILCFATQGAASEQDARIVAQNFLNYKHSNKLLTKLVCLRLKSDITGTKQVYGYRVELSGGGYLLISESKNVLPIKAFSLHNNFVDLPLPYQDFLLHDMQALFRAAFPGRLPQAIGAASKAWNFLLHTTRLPQSYVPNTFLLSTTWDQGYPYNKFLPEVDGEHVLVGCVNVAIGQIMRYHQWPPSGKGVVYNNWNGRELRSVLYHPLDYSNMPNGLRSSAVSTVEVDETARLLNDLGIINKTDFGVANSGTSFDPHVLIENYGYARSINSTATYVEGVFNTSFFPTLQNEIDNGRPVLLSIPDHMAVVDGYAADLTGPRMMHLNLGWGGTADDFYYLDNDFSAGGYTFYAQYPFIIYYGITPCRTMDCASVLETNDHLTDTGASGVFDYADDDDWYEVYLKGVVSLSGSQPGYIGKTFFISLYDNDGRLESNLEGLSPGRYFLRVSLRSEQGQFYTYNPNSASYTITVSGSRLSAVEQQALNTDHPPEFATALPETIVLGQNRGEPYKLFLDVRDPDNNAIILSTSNSNPQAVSVALVGRVLAITPLLSGVASKITITATANNAQIVGWINVLVGESDVAFGPSFTLKGTFASIDSVNYFPVVLDGNCTIMGDRGFSNQAFYTGITQGGQTVVDDSNTTISNSFGAGLYKIHASISSAGANYGYTPGAHDNFFLSGRCQSYSLSLEKMAALLPVNLDGLMINSHVYSLADLLSIIRIMVDQEGGMVSTFQDLDLNGDAQLDMGDFLLICRKLSGL